LGNWVIQKEINAIEAKVPRQPAEDIIRIIILLFMALMNDEQFKGG